MAGASFSQPPVLVNLPEFRLHALDDDYRVALFKPVIVGQAFRHQSQSRERDQICSVPAILGSDTDDPASGNMPHVEKDRNYVAEKILRW